MKEGTMATVPSPAVAAAREKVRKVAPKLIDLTEKVVFGDVWERPGLSKRDRSLITVAALMATYRPEQLRVHIARALENGVTKEELGEVITHLAFYSGWPTAMTAATIAQDILEQR
jgi:4-carboxymuconolactone decarboxylase